MLVYGAIEIRHGISYTNDDLNGKYYNQIQGTMGLKWLCYTQAKYIF